jgi:putative toxin-antitoxin system antitoxin component (TIGR02293 family)
MKTETGRYSEELKGLRNALGTKNIGADVEGPLDFVRVADKGMNASVIGNFRKYFNLPLAVTADMLDISGPTLYRWTKQNRKLGRNHSVKLMEVTRLLLLGSEILGGRDAFFQWMELPNTALGGMPPIRLIGLPEGISKVRDVLGRLEHGVFS